MSETGQEIPIPTEEEILEANAPKEKSREKKVVLAAAKARITAALFGISLLSSALTVACEAGSKDSSPAKSPLPTYPVGIDVITNTPMPSEKATIADFLTSTAKAEAIKTAQPTKTPDATTTAETENLHQGFQIELDDKVKALQAEGKALPSGLTVEKYQAKIQEELNKFPKIGDLTVKIFFPTQEAIDSGYVNDSFLGVESGGPKILLRADNRGDVDATISLAELDHEIGHYYSIRADGQYLKTILTEAEYEQAEQIEKDASNDLEFGLANSQDAFFEYFSDKMIGGTEFPQADASATEQMACSRKRMLEIMLSGLNSESDKTPNPFLTLIQDQLKEIHEYSTSTEMHQKAEYTKDAIATLDKNQAMVDKISAENPLMAQVYKSIRENGSVLTQQNMSRTSSASNTFNMTGFSKGESFENLSKWGAAIFLEREYLAGNPIVVEALKDQDAEIKQFRIYKEIKARKEGIADQIKVQERVTGANTPAGRFLTFYSNVAVRLSR